MTDQTPPTDRPLTAGDDELIERGLRMSRSYDAVRFLRDALSATTARLTSYDWNADPDGITKQQGDAFSAADRVFADLNAAVDAIPEIDLPECQACGGTGKIEEAAKTEGANQHSACVRPCDECDGCGFASDDEDASLARPATSAASEGAVDRVMAVLNHWFDGRARIDRNSDMVAQLAALASPPVSERERELEGALREARDAVDFFDRVKASTQDEQIAVGRDHWNRMEAALRAVAVLTAQPEKPV